MSSNFNDTLPVPTTPFKKARDDLSSRFDILQMKKNVIVRRCMDYAEWTLPGLFPRMGINPNIEEAQPVESLGARAVNHLANKLISTLFQLGQPFFRIKVSSAQSAELKKAAQAGDEQAIFILKNLDQMLADAEQEAMTLLDYNRYRTEAITAAKHLIITGNALMYNPEGKGKVQVYGLQDYCIQRDLSGQVIEIITRDRKIFETFSPEIQAQLLQGGGTGKKKRKYSDETEVDIYTQIAIDDDGKYCMCQNADHIVLDSYGLWSHDELPWIPLTWNLLRNEDYGRGLVEDYAGTFHSLMILTDAYLKAVVLAADIKFGVDPASVIDVSELNRGESGSYLPCKKDDVFAIQVDKQLDLQTVASMIDRLEKQLQAAFLLNSAVQRDAERVTAEEIKYVAQELETAYGGVYSRFAFDWQYKTAVLLLKRIKLKIGSNLFPQIITGLDSLSNAGEMNAMELFVRDLSNLQSVPEPILGAIDPRAYAQFCAIRRGVDWQKILKSPQQMQQDAEAQQKAEQQAQVSQAGANVAEHAGKSAVEGQQ